MNVTIKFENIKAQTVRPARRRKTYRRRVLRAAQMRQALYALADVGRLTYPDVQMLVLVLGVSHA